MATQQAQDLICAYDIIAGFILLTLYSPQRLEAQPVHLQLKCIRIISVDGQCAWEAQRGTSPHLHATKQRHHMQDLVKHQLLMGGLVFYQLLMEVKN
jgi:hypothetical protein